MDYRTFTAMLDCTACGGPLPLQGPMRTVRCTACQSDNRLDLERVAKLLKFASQGVGSWMDVAKWTYSPHHPCPQCALAIDLAAFPIGAEATVPCAGCATAVRAFPPPPWLHEQLPGLAAIYGAERDPADDASGLPAPAAVAKSAAPIVMRCPECGGSLRITNESARTVTCEHCNSAVYLPDALWRSLHPVKRATFWSIAWALPPLPNLAELEPLFADTMIETAGTPLVTAAEIRSAEAKLAKRHAEAASAARERQVRVDATVSARVTQRKRTLIMLVIFGAVIALSVVIALIATRG